MGNNKVFDKADKIIGVCQLVMLVRIGALPEKNRHKKASKNEMNRSISLIYENRPHSFHGLFDNEPLPV